MNGREKETIQRSRTRMFYSEETVGAQPVGKNWVIMSKKMKEQCGWSKVRRERLGWDGTEYF